MRCETYPHPVQVSEGPESGESIKLSTDATGKLLLATITSQYPDAIGLWFRSDSGGCEVVRLFENAFEPPHEGWGCKKYFIAKGVSTAVEEDTLRTHVSGPPPEVLQRNNLASMPASTDQPHPAHHEPPIGEKRKLGTEAQELVISKSEEDLLTDLIVLGLRWTTKEEQFASYFSKFGELAHCKLKLDSTTKRSKGYGFIRFQTEEAVQSVLGGSHFLAGRPLTVKFHVPNSKNNAKSKRSSLPTTNTTSSTSGSSQTSTASNSASPYPHQDNSHNQGNIDHSNNMLDNNGSQHAQAYRDLPKRSGGPYAGGHRMLGGHQRSQGRGGRHGNSRLELSNENLDKCDTSGPLLHSKQRRQQESQTYQSQQRDMYASRSIQDNRQRLQNCQPHESYRQVQENQSIQESSHQFHRDKGQNRENQQRHPEPPYTKGNFRTVDKYPSDTTRVSGRANDSHTVSDTRQYYNIGGNTAPVGKPDVGTYQSNGGHGEVSQAGTAIPNSSTNVDKRHSRDVTGGPSQYVGSDSSPHSTAAGDGNNYPSIPDLSLINQQMRQRVQLLQQQVQQQKQQQKQPQQLQQQQPQQQQQQQQQQPQQQQPQQPQQQQQQQQQYYQNQQQQPHYQKNQQHQQQHYPNQQRQQQQHYEKQQHQQPHHYQNQQHHHYQNQQHHHY